MKTGLWNHRVGCWCPALFTGEFFQPGWTFSNSIDPSGHITFIFSLLVSVLMSPWLLIDRDFLEWQRISMLLLLPLGELRNTGIIFFFFHSLVSVDKSNWIYLQLSYLQHTELDWRLILETTWYKLPWHVWCNGVYWLNVYHDVSMFYVGANKLIYGLDGGQCKKMIHAANWWLVIWVNACWSFDCLGAPWIL